MGNCATTEARGQTEPSAEPSYDLPTPTSIRLLKITHAHIPEQGERSVWFTICAFELSDAPDFLALSYTWTEPMRPDMFSTDETAPGIPSQLPTVSVSGTASSKAPDPDATPAFIGDRKYKATKNLRDGLAQIFLSGLGSNWIWADAVCIDQENEAEKEVQVAMMDEIYSRAMAVVIWLGADESDLEDFVWIHGEFFDALNRFVVENGVEAIQGQQGLDPAFTSRLGVTPPGGSWVGVWQAYFRFCRRRRWFSRAWIVQEVVLAGHVMVLCGGKDVEWPRMVLMAELIVLLQWQSQVGVGVEEGFGRALGDEVVRLFAARRIMDMATPTAAGDSENADGSEVGEQPDKVEQRRKWFTAFLEMLLHTRVYSATDPRDKIYSLVGILKKMLPLRMELPFRVDYSEHMTAQRLCISITTMFLRELPDLKALSLAFACDSTRADLPTASRISDNRLLFHGAEFDRIVATASPMWDVVRTQVIDDCLALCEDLSPEYLQTHTGPGEVLWRTMTANTFEQQPAPGSLATSFKSWVSVRLAAQIVKRTLRHDEAAGQVTLVGLKELFEEVAKTGSLRILTRLRASTVEESRSIPTAEEVFEIAQQMYNFQLHYILAKQGITFIDPPIPQATIEEETVRIEGEAAAFKHAISPVLPFRRLYRTEKGYLGLGPASAEPGDRVYLLGGANVPFVLRTAANGAFELMGETYLHGFMDGEMGRRVGDGTSGIILA
ncbi:heterokaryon incompatibility protein-domain-containing protein [Coniochaeta sp. 2T2.1]|nr:heterokaryon incompatibility protein-domain-containing protein [Coniochaeta sp. 2T2.1]